MALVTLLTDFGIKDTYVAQMKGVILGRCRECRIVDLTHQVSRQDVREGAFLLETAVPYFPKRTIHVGVVDPGVGSKRLPIVIECKRGVLVGPDNGLLTLAAKKLGFRAAYTIVRSPFHPKQLSSTFHGRDIFANTAGLLADGWQPSSVGPSLSRPIRLKIPASRLIRGQVECTVLHIDSFGNLITNVSNERMRGLGLREGQRLTVLVRKRRREVRFVGSYHEVAAGALAVLPGSQGYMELAAREANANEILGVEVSSRIMIMWAD